MEKLNIVLKMANDLNKKCKILVPIFDELEICKNNIDNCIFIAKDNKGLVEQLFIDIPLKENESLEERIMKIQNETNEYIKSNNLDNFTKFYNDYDNGIFKFKVYIQDTIVNDKLIRQFDVYFENKIDKDVYKLTLANGPFKIDSNMQLLSTNDKNNDLITNRLNSMLKIILDNIKYNN